MRLDAGIPLFSSRVAGYLGLEILWTSRFYSTNQPNGKICTLWAAVSNRLKKRVGRPRDPPCGVGGAGAGRQTAPTVPFETGKGRVWAGGDEGRHGTDDQSLRARVGALRRDGEHGCAHRGRYPADAEGNQYGSVATLELRRSLAIASAKLDRHRAEQTKNEAME